MTKDLTLTPRERDALTVALQAISDALAGLASKVDNLEALSGRVQHLERALGSLAEKFDTVIDVLKARDTVIDVLKARVDELFGELRLIDDLVGRLATKVDALPTMVPVKEGVANVALAVDFPLAVDEHALKPRVDALEDAFASLLKAHVAARIDTSASDALDARIDALRKSIAELARECLYIGPMRDVCDLLKARVEALARECIYIGPIRDVCDLLKARVDALEKSYSSFASNWPNAFKATLDTSASDALKALKARVNGLEESQTSPEAFRRLAERIDARLDELDQRIEDTWAAAVLDRGQGEQPTSDDLETEDPPK